MKELNHEVKPSSDVVITELEGEGAVLLHLGTKTYYTLNNTGLRIWQMLESGIMPGEIMEKLSGEFDVSPEKAKEITLNLIGELVTQKLVRAIDD